MSTGKTAFALLGSLLTLSTLAGCSMGTIQLSGPLTEVSAVKLQGSIHGGQQGVAGATITMYRANRTGYGGAPVSLMNNGTTVTSDRYGYFSVTGTYTCAPTDLVYIVASGGNPGLAAGTNNSAIKMVAALGPCSGLSASTFIDINEVSTAAAAFALGQYFGANFAIGNNASNGAGDSFGAPNTTQAQLGLTNAFATVNNLVVLGDGSAVTSQTLTGTGSAATLGSITTTPESAKLYTIANILAACINSDGGASSPCTTLFADVAPTNGTAPTNTLEAAVYMSLNPTSTNGSGSHVADLYNLTSATPPFTGLTVAPTDWTLGILYTSSTLFPQAQNIAIDAGGNVWVVSNGSSVNGLLTEVSPNGTPLVSTTMATTIGGNSANISTVNPRNLAIDLNGNVFVPTSSSSAYLFEYTPSSANSVGVAVGKACYGVAVDASNNVWVTQQSSSSSYELTEYLGGQLSTTNQVQYPLVGQTAISASNTSNTIAPGQNAAFDLAGNLWFTTASASISGTSAFILPVAGQTAASCSAFPCQTTYSSNPYTTVTAGSLSTPYGLAPTPGYMWIVDNGTANVSKEAVGGATGTAYGPTSNAVATPAPRFIAADGSSNLWVTNRGTGNITEFNASGAVLSTAAGFTHSGVGTANGIGVDPSGNVWVANNTSSASATDPTSIFELVGAASPVVTPLAQQVKNATVARP